MKAPQMKSKRIQKANDFKDQLRNKVVENFKFDIKSHIPVAEPVFPDEEKYELITIRRCGSFKTKAKALEIVETMKKGNGVRIEGQGKLAEKAVNLLELVKELAFLKPEDYSIRLMNGGEVGLKIIIGEKK